MCFGKNDSSGWDLSSLWYPVFAKPERADRFRRNKVRFGKIWFEKLTRNI